MDSLSGRPVEFAGIFDFRKGKPQSTSLRRVNWKKKGFSPKQLLVAGMKYLKNMVGQDRRFTKRGTGFRAVFINAADPL